MVVGHDCGEATATSPFGRSKTERESEEGGGGSLAVGLAMGRVRVVLIHGRAPEGQASTRREVATARTPLRPTAGGGAGEEDEGR